MSDELNLKDGVRIPTAIFAVFLTAILAAQGWMTLQIMDIRERMRGIEMVLKIMK